MNVSDECNLFAVSSAIVNMDIWRVLHCTEREKGRGWVQSEEEGLTMLAGVADPGEAVRADLSRERERETGMKERNESIRVS